MRRSGSPLWRHQDIPFILYLRPLTSNVTYVSILHGCQPIRSKSQQWAWHKRRHHDVSPSWRHFHIVETGQCTPESGIQSDRSHTRMLQNTLKARDNLWSLQEFMLIIYIYISVGGYFCDVCLTSHNHIDGLVQEDVTPLLTHWKNVFLSLSHRYQFIFSIVAGQ